MDQITTRMATHNGQEFLRMSMEPGDWRLGSWGWLCFLLWAGHRRSSDNLGSSHNLSNLFPIAEFDCPGCRVLISFSSRFLSSSACADSLQTFRVSVDPPPHFAWHDLCCLQFACLPSLYSHHPPPYLLTNLPINNIFVYIIFSYYCIICG